MNRLAKLWTLFFLLSSFCGFAQVGDLVVFTTDGAKLHLALDSKFQNPTASTYVKVTDIPEGNYWVMLYFDNDRKAVKSNLKILGNKENSFVVEQDGGSWKLKTYSSVPRSQVNAAGTGKAIVAYSRDGVQVDGMASTSELKKSEVEQEKEIVRVQGTRDDLEAQAQRNRAGTYSGTTYEGETATASAKPMPEEGTTITKRYIETKNPDGSVTITEEATTTIRTIVDRNGQPQMRTKRSVAITPTNYTCLPMAPESFEVLLTKAKGMQDAERLQLYQKDLKEQCLTPFQIQQLGDLFEDINNRNTYAQIALPINADPRYFPYDLRDVAMDDVNIADPAKADYGEPFPDEESTEAQEARDVEDAVGTNVSVAATETDLATEEPQTLDTPKTKAEIRAEMRLAKARAKAAKKAANEKAKAERKAAKEKAKADRLAAKNK